MPEREEIEFEMGFLIEVCERSQNVYKFDSSLKAF